MWQQRQQHQAEEEEIHIPREEPEIPAIGATDSGFLPFGQSIAEDKLICSRQLCKVEGSASARVIYRQVACMVVEKVLLTSNWNILPTNWAAGQLQ